MYKNVHKYFEVINNVLRTFTTAGQVKMFSFILLTSTFVLRSIKYLVLEIFLISLETVRFSCFFFSSWIMHQAGMISFFLKVEDKWIIFQYMQLVHEMLLFWNLFRIVSFYIITLRSGRLIVNSSLKNTFSHVIFIISTKVIASSKKHPQVMFKAVFWETSGTDVDSEYKGFRFFFDYLCSTTIVCLW